ncbi:MAG: iron dependent repressor, metal binding and dimerization domain protein, partial [Candidatus Neomarinimicrobiota bacterium]
MMQINSHLVDEILEAIWIAREDGRAQVDNLQVECPIDVDDFDLPGCLAQMQKDGLVKIDKDKVDFTDVGLKRARDIIRRHRLAQRLLMDVLDVSEKEAEDMACKF